MTISLSALIWIRSEMKMRRLWRELLVEECWQELSRHAPSWLMGHGLLTAEKHRDCLNQDKPWARLPHLNTSRRQQTSALVQQNTSKHDQAPVAINTGVSVMAAAKQEMLVWFSRKHVFSGHCAICNVYIILIHMNETCAPLQVWKLEAQILVCHRLKANICTSPCSKVNQSLLVFFKQ